MSTMNDQERQILAPVLARAATDSAYRERLKQDPHAAIAEVTGIAPPATFRVQFIEKPAGIDEVFVLPDPVDEEVELTEEELEAVAGGLTSEEGDCWWTKVCEDTIDITNSGSTVA